MKGVKELIKKFDKPLLVTQSSLPPIDEFKEELDNIWQSKWLTNMGVYHENFKSKLRSYLRTENVDLFVNGHLALDIAIKSLNLKGEVITTPFTFASTTHAIVLNGLKPVFCDINESDYTIDSNKIEALITDQTSAVMPVHVYGNPCDIKQIEQIAKKYDLKVIYDAAHAFGVEIESSGIGCFGDISMFSCHATKVFNSIEGGILTYNDKSLTKRLYLLKNFGISGPESVEITGLNAKMNEFQSLMGLLNLKYVDHNIQKRKKIAELYTNELKDVKGISFIKPVKNVKQNYSYLPVLINEEKFGKTRDQLYDLLIGYNVYTRKYFYPLVTDFECYKNKYKSEIPVARYVSERIITLPIYSELALSDAENICAIIKEIQSL